MCCLTHLRQRQCLEKALVQYKHCDALRVVLQTMPSVLHHDIKVLLLGTNLMAPFDVIPDSGELMICL